MNKTSIYPSVIDDRVFFQDINLNQVALYNQYQDFILKGEYSKASNLIKQSNITTYSAWLLNYFDGKLYNIETKSMSVQALIDKYKNDAQKIAAQLYLTYYGSEPTTGLSNGITWIS